MLGQWHQLWRCGKRLVRGQDAENGSVIGGHFDVVAVHDKRRLVAHQSQSIQRGDVFRTYAREHVVPASALKLSNRVRDVGLLVAQ